MTTKHEKHLPTGADPAQAAQAASAASSTASASIFTRPLDQFRADVATAEGHIKAAREILGGMLTMTAQARKDSAGKFRDGESAGFYPLIDFAVQAPQYFVGLADKDEGSDPDHFEPLLLRDRLERRDLLARIDVAAQQLSQEVSDSTLYLGDLTKPVLLAAYGIAKSLAVHDVKVRSAVATIIDFYSAVAKKGAETRAVNKAAQAAAEAKAAEAAAHSPK